MTQESEEEEEGDAEVVSNVYETVETEAENTMARELLTSEDPDTMSSVYTHELYVLASFPGPHAAFGCTKVLQATKSWAGPGNEATYVHV